MPPRIALEESTITAFMWIRALRLLPVISLKRLTGTPLTRSRSTKRGSARRASTIARASTPLWIAPGSQVRVYVGLPLWVEVRDADGLLADLPLVVLSDTWFGTPLEGTLCYATRTWMSTLPGTLGLAVHRALCPVDVHNRGEDVLALQRLRIPAPHLTLVRRDGALWTSAVEVVRTSVEGESEVTVGALGAGEVVGAPREGGSPPRMVRAINAVWRSLGSFT